MRVYQVEELQLRNNLEGGVVRGYDWVCPHCRKEHHIDGVGLRKLVCDECGLDLQFISEGPRPRWEMFKLPRELRPSRVRLLLDPDNL